MGLVDDPGFKPGYLYSKGWRQFSWIYIYIYIKREALVEDPGFTTRIKLEGLTHPGRGAHTAAEYVRSL